MKRVFALDVLDCPHRGGSRQRIDLLTDGSVVCRILEPFAPSAEPPRQFQPSLRRPKRPRGFGAIRSFAASDPTVRTST